jgi:ribosomal protein S18 acetylase RimI-like enzyme
MDEEEKAWMSDLSWDYTPIRKILASFVKQKLLPGYVAVNSKAAIGYTYFLVNQAKGIIGALYASETSQSQEAVEQLLTLTISCLKDSQNIQRVEAQIMPFHSLGLSATFAQNGFRHFPRYYLDLDLNALPDKKDSNYAGNIVPWKSEYLERAAEMTLASYRDQTDAEICSDYCTQMGCVSYLRSLVENPGCGIFMPEASFMSLDKQGFPCGFVICCRISTGVGMIPQIAIHPSHQGQGLGNNLIRRTFNELKSAGFHSISLTVTKKNRRAFEWYQRLGFKIRKEFGAYVWQR